MATIRDVANSAGVSITTVSHVINESRFVSPAVVRRVHRAIKTLGYQPNALARSLRSKNTSTFGLILPDSSNPFFAEVARGVEDYAFQQGYNVIFGSSEGDLDKEKIYLRVLIEKQVDGLIFVAAGESAQNIRRVLSEPLALVVVDREFKNIVADFVTADNRHGGYLATEHLLALGHRTIACIAGPSAATPSADRVKGYHDALKAHSVRFGSQWVERGNFQPASGFAITQSFLARGGLRPTAIFACNDLMAMGALAAIRKAGLRVPEDIAVAGFDDIALASFTSPALTTVRQPKYEMGKLATEILIEHIKNPRDHKMQRRLVPVRLVVRESTCREGTNA